MDIETPEAKEVRHKAESVIKRLSWAVEQKAEALVDAQAAFESVRYCAIAESLGKVSLREIPGLKISRDRLERIMSEGYETLFDVWVTPRSEFEKIYRVGPSTVGPLKVLADHLAKDVRVRIDPENRTQEQAALLNAVWRQEEIDRILRLGHRVPFASRWDLKKLMDQSDLVEEWALIKFVARAKDLWDRFWGDKSDLRRAEIALDNLKKALVSPPVETDLHLVNAFESHHPSTHIWDDYLRRNAEFSFRLAQLGVQQGDERAETGGLPSKIVEDVHAYSMDESLLNVTLYPYQRFGAKYALALNRTLLGDEMGLGKTIQALAALAHVWVDHAWSAGHWASWTKELGHVWVEGHSTLMVICPAAVVENWICEISDKSSLPSVAIQGSAKQRQKVFSEWKRCGGVGIMSFETARILHQCDHLEGISLGLLVVDEAHFVKNTQSARSQAVAHLAECAERVLFMSGTPMENWLSEFYSLIRHLQPAVADECEQAVSSGEIVAPHLQRERVSTVYLRRNQEEVLEQLPKIIESDVWITLGAAEKAAFDSLIRHRPRRNFMAMRRAVTIGGGGTTAKLERLKQIVEEASAEGRKVLVFSFFTDVVKTVSDQLKRIHGANRVFSLGVPKMRQSIIETFSAAEGPAILVAQIQRGGTGLNIQAASVVVLMEPQVKPSLEEQAKKRAHRIGQIHRVSVFRLLARDSVDEVLVEILKEKTEVFDKYIRPSAVNEAEVARRAVERMLEKLTHPAKRKSERRVKKSKVGDLRKRGQRKPRGQRSG